MLRLRCIVALPLLVALSACAVSHSMPPFSMTRGVGAGTAPGPLPSELPARREFKHRKRITREYDHATDQTRVAVTTHRGTYFFWIQRPRLTFFYVHAGVGDPQPPAAVFLIFRTVYPQVPTHNRLTLLCNGSPHELGITPTFWYEQGPMMASRHYMYALPLAEFAQLLSCSTASISLGDVTAPFSNSQLEALRDFVTP